MRTARLAVEGALLAFEDDHVVGGAADRLDTDSGHVRGTRVRRPRAWAFEALHLAILGAQ